MGAACDRSLKRGHQGLHAQEGPGRSISRHVQLEDRGFFPQVIERLYEPEGRKGTEGLKDFYPRMVHEHLSRTVERPGGGRDAIMASKDGRNCRSCGSVHYEDVGDDENGALQGHPLSILPMIAHARCAGLGMIPWITSDGNIYLGIDAMILA